MRDGELGGNMMVVGVGRIVMLAAVLSAFEVKRR